MKLRFLSAVCCLSVLLLLPSCHRNTAVQEENKSLSSKTSETYSVDSEGSGGVTAPSNENVHPSTTSTSPQTNSSAETSNGTTATTASPSQTQTTTPVIDPLMDGRNSESDLALGGKMVFSDQWIYLIDKTAMDGGSRFSTDFSDVKEFKPGNCGSAPCMEFAGGRIYYAAEVDSEYRLYSCDAAGNDQKDSGIRMFGDGIGFRICNNSVFYVNSQSVLMKEDLSGENQIAVLDLAPFKYTLATSRMTIADDSLFLMLTNDEKNEVDFYRISLRDGSGELIYAMPFQSGSDYIQFCANGQTLISYNGWLYFHGYNELYKMSYDGKTFATIHVGNRMIDSMLIQDGRLYYMEDGSMYAISLDNDTVKSIAFISLPFQHDGILVHDYTNVRFLGSDTEYIYMTWTQPLNVTEGSQITDSRVLIERIQLDGNNQKMLFASK